MMIKINIFRTFLVAALFCFSGVAVAQAGDAKPLGTFGDWSAYVFIEDGSKVCYIASQPAKAEGSYSKRGDIYALLTHRPAEGTKNVFSYITGYGYKKDSEVTLSANGENFVLFTQNDTAWAPDADTDNKIARALRKGSNMVIKGMSSRGTKTTDTFSLKGSGKALDAVARECGI